VQGSGVDNADAGRSGMLVADATERNDHADGRRLRATDTALFSMPVCDGVEVACLVFGNARRVLSSDSGSSRRRC